MRGVKGKWSVARGQWSVKLPAASYQANAPIPEGKGAVWRLETAIGEGGWLAPIPALRSALYALRPLQGAKGGAPEAAQGATPYGAPEGVRAAQMQVSLKADG